MPVISTTPEANDRTNDDGRNKQSDAEDRGVFRLEGHPHGGGQSQRHTDDAEAHTVLGGLVLAEASKAKDEE